MTDSADDSASGGEDDTEFWLAIPGFRESLLESEADIAAGRTFDEEEIRARFVPPPQDGGPHP